MTTLFISHSAKDKAWAERTHTALVAGGYRCLFLDSDPDDGLPFGPAALASGVRRQP